MAIQTEPNHNDVTTVAGKTTPAKNSRQNISHVRDKNLPAILLYVDFAKAFDFIHR